MCYRLASELSDRIAAIAPVAGTMIGPEIRARRPVPVLHFHGTKDTFVPFDGPGLEGAGVGPAQGGRGGGPGVGEARRLPRGAGEGRGRPRGRRRDHQAGGLRAGA